jgi:REP element-mobilizing transposase RayT
MVDDPFLLDAPRRDAVVEAITAVAMRNGWQLHALNVRTNHAHAVVTATVTPERVLNAFKAWSTGRMSRLSLIQRGRRVWTRHGSTRYVWDERSLDAVIQYVDEAQGPPPGRASPGPQAP